MENTVVLFNYEVRFERKIFLTEKENFKKIFKENNYLISLTSHWGNMWLIICKKVVE